MAHVAQRYGMDADHQLVVTFIFLYQLQRTGFVGGRPVQRVSQQQQYRFFIGKFGRLENSMSETPFLMLINIMQAFADIEYVVLILLCLLV